MKAVKLNLESGNLFEWADKQSERLSKLRTFAPKGWTAVGSAKVYKSLRAQLREAGLDGNYALGIAQDICDMARLKANAQ